MPYETLDRDLIDEVLDAGEYTTYGVRVHNREIQGEVNVGDELPASWVWVEGEWTDERLPGTCCLDVFDNYAPYEGDRVLLIGSHSSDVTYGEDEGEILLKNPTVLVVIERKGHYCQTNVSNSELVCAGFAREITDSLAKIY